MTEKLEGEALIKRLNDNVQFWMEESFKWQKRSLYERQATLKLKGLLLLTDPVVSSEGMNELSAKQFAEFKRWDDARDTPPEPYSLQTQDERKKDG